MAPATGQPGGMNGAAAAISGLPTDAGGERR